jgi:hypothetical protein
MQNSYKWTGSVSLSTLAAEVEDANIAGEHIVGRWGKNLVLRVSAPSRTLAQQFVNWPNDPKSVLRFTRRYGALSEPKPDAAFELSLQEWRSHQAWLRRHWGVNPPGIKVGMSEGDMLQIGPGKLSLQLQNLARFVEFEIWLAPVARRRVCARPDCETPYFIASNPKQQFCDEKCANWAQQQHKQQWWAEHGEQWRAEHKSNRSRKAALKGKKSRGSRVRSRG